MRIALGLLLLAAAGLKGYQFATEPVFEEDLLGSPGAQFALIEGELILGLWLLSGFWPRWSWRAAVAAFTLFAAASLSEALAGETSCGCFGRVEVDPWYTLLLDLAALCALFCCAPARPSSAAHPMKGPLPMLRTARGLAFLLPLVAGTAALAVCLFRAEYAAGYPLTVFTQDLDFGGAWAQSDFPWMLRVRNTSTQPVEISELRTSCGCTSINPKSLTIWPKAVGAFHLTIDLTRGPPASDQPVRDFRMKIVPVVAEVSGPPRAWIVRGKVRETLTVSASVVRFGRTLTRGLPAPRKTVKMQVRAGLHSLRAHCDPAYANVELKPDGGGEYRLSIEPNSNRAAGAFDFPIELLASDHDGRTVRRAISVVGTISEKVEASPSELRFGAVPVGAVLHGRVVLLARTGTPFSIQELLPESSNTTLRSSEDGAGRKAIEIAHKVTGCGDHEHEIGVVAKTPSGKVIRLCIPLTYHGLSEDLAERS